VIEKKKRRKDDISYGIIVDPEGEQITDFTDDEETLKAPYIKPKENAEKTRRPN